MFKTLLSRIVLVASAAMALIILLFMAANQYAMMRLRTQAITAQEMLLELYAAQMDETLESLRMGMMQRINEDLDLNALTFYAPDTDEYKLCAQNCKKWLQQSLPVNRMISSQYIYAKNTKLLLSASKSFSSTRHMYITGHLPLFVSNARTKESMKWSHVYTSGYLNESGARCWLLVKPMKVSQAVTLGTAVTVSDLIPPLEDTMTHSGTITKVYSMQGLLLAQSQRGANEAEDLDHDITKGLGMLGRDEPFRVHSQQTNESYIAISQTLDTASVCVVTLLPESQVYHQLVHFRRIGSFLPFALVLLAAGAIIAIRTLYKPFGELVAIMDGVAKGDLSLRLPKGRTSEFVQVNARFNEMVQRIDCLNRDVHEQTVRTHRAEMMHLQSQINPHFYQNTLNLIYNLAALQQYELIQKTSLHLADYFRFIMRSGNQMVALSRELEHINNYMELQKIRYPNAIAYHQIAAPDAMDCLVPPLIIQPFVENCAIHGYTTKRLFEVTVRVTRKKGCILIEVQDNGRGMPPDVLENINGLLANPSDDPGSHIGLWNVATRLDRRYGGRAVLHIQSQMDAGTFVCMEIPAQYPQGGVLDDDTDCR